jgi:CheY-like chemotaxis protein
VTQLAVGGDSPRPLNQSTILVVDDDADMREALRDVLGAEGYSVILACNGKVAFDLLLATLKRPCGIILDITMPVMSGAEFYQAIRAVANLTDIPVVFLTSNPSAAPSGVPIMQKTVNLERLLGMVAALF